MKILCFGVRDYERQLFREAEAASGHELILCPQYLDDSNYQLALGYQALIIRANCSLSDAALDELYAGGLRYLLTRTVGFEHMPLRHCKELGIKTAYAPGYSPASIAELALTLALNLLRNVPEALANSAQGDFRLSGRMFGRELGRCTVGIVGCGRIGKAAAKLFHALGARVLAMDPVQDPQMQGILSYCFLEELLRQSDIVSLHSSYAPGKNQYLIGKDQLAQMKDGAILVNTARGELVDTAALIEHIQSGHLLGAGLDVVEQEKAVFFQKREKSALSPLMQQLLDLYPRVLITPHISSSTDVAVSDALAITMKNLEQLLQSGTCDNSL